MTSIQRRPPGQSVRIKICGIRCPADLNCVVQSGADAVGLMRVPDTSRFVDLEQAQTLLQLCPDHIFPVLIVQNPQGEELAELELIVKKQLHPRLNLQFHGDEPADFCASFGLPWIKVISLDPRQEQLTPSQLIGHLQAKIKEYARANALIFDAVKVALDGNQPQGFRFDWSIFERLVSDTAAALADAKGGPSHILTKR